MIYKIIEKKKDSLEIEFYSKSIPHALASTLSESGVDAYTYEPHPLIPGFRLKIEAPNPEAALKKAVSKLSTDWKKLESEIEKQLK